MKRTLALALALLMTFSFTACRKSNTSKNSDGSLSDSSEEEWEYEYVYEDGEDGSGTGSKGSGTNGSTSGGKANTTKVTNTNIDLGVSVPKGEYDFNGATVTIAVWDSAVEPQLGKTAVDDAKYYAMHYAMQKYNIGAIEYKQMASGQSAYNTTFVKYAASGDFWGDIMYAHSDYAKAYIQQGLIQDLTPTLGKLSSDNFRTDCCSIGSGNYGFISKGAINLREAYLIYNTDLIKKNNLADPQSVYGSGQWTWEKYQEYVRTITDVNKDIYGMALVNFHQLFNDPSFEADYKDGSGKYVCGWLDSNYGQNRNKLYNWIIDLYNSGSVFGDFCIGQEAIDAANDAFRNGKVGFKMADNSTCKAFKSEGLKNFKIVAAPTQDGNHNYYNMSAHYAFYSLPANNARYSNDMMLALSNDLFCITDSTHGKAYYSVNESQYAEELYSTYFLSIEDAKYAIELGKSTNSYYPWGVFVNESFQVAREMLQPVLEGKTTWAKANAQYSSQRQSDLDKSVNSGIYK